MTKIAIKTCRMIRAMMADLMGDDEWLEVATNEGVYNCCAIDRDVVATTEVVLAHCDELMANSMTPERCV